MTPRRRGGSWLGWLVFASVLSAQAGDLQPFTTDGCSDFPDGTPEQRTLWRDCCVAHDRAYWRGGSYDERVAADQALRDCVASKGKPDVALVMLAGVRIGGSPFWPTTFRWGYGWPWPRGYRTLTLDEQRQIADAERAPMSNETIASETAISIYPGFGDARSFIVEGRVLEARAIGQSDSWLANLWRNLRQLSNDERKHAAIDVRVASLQRHTLTDNEGYFRIEEQGHDLTPGWHEVVVTTSDDGAHGDGGVLIVAPDQTLGIISDIDDTILVSEVTAKLHLLANTFLKSPQQRSAVPGMAAFYQRVMSASAHPEGAPVIYLSGSPRQLYANVESFLRSHGFPPGPIITKRVTDDNTSDPWLDQFKYKTAKIEDILARLPQVNFVLVGDDGERDPETYDEIRRRHPQRVQQIWIRQVSPDPNRPRFPGQRLIQDGLSATGTTRDE